MLTIINSNRMTPPIAPVGLDYVAGAARRAGIDVELLDLGLADDPDRALGEHFAARSPELVAVSLRNVDDCFWPGGEWFVSELQTLVGRIREVSAAPIVLGGAGFSIFARQIVERVGADFGVRGDGERALPALVEQLRGERRFESVEGLVWRQDGAIRSNAPAWPGKLSIPTARDFVDNAAYFRRGGQIGVETKRGCSRRCVYCADPLAKGSAERLRDPKEVADEVEALLAQGVDVLHLCDSEFNVPLAHARAVCDEFIRRRFEGRVRWYTYMAVVPFDDDLAGRMRRAGCVGINFTADSASAALLAAHRHPHRKADLARCVPWCRSHGIAVMLDLLLGSPGETPATAEETIRFVQQIDPDCAGAALGVRLYPDTASLAALAAEDPVEKKGTVPICRNGPEGASHKWGLSPFSRNPGIRRRYEGALDLLRPTFYIAPALGETPARLIRELIGGDRRFFEPQDESPSVSVSAEAGQRGDHNYNANQALSDAIASGQRGAYWDILRRLRA